MQSVVDDNLGFLAAPDRAWQPTDYLPDLSSENWREHVESLRPPARHISNKLLVVLVGEMVPKGAPPIFPSPLNLTPTAAEGPGWLPGAKWLRGGPAGESRHGDLLNAYLRLT